MIRRIESTIFTLALPEGLVLLHHALECAQLALDANIQRLVHDHRQRVVHGPDLVGYDGVWLENGRVLGQYLLGVQPGAHVHRAQHGEIPVQQLADEQQGGKYSTGKYLAINIAGEVN